MERNGADGAGDAVESTSAGTAGCGATMARASVLVFAATASGGSGSAMQPASTPAAIDTTSSARRHGFGDNGIDALWPRRARCET